MNCETLMNKIDELYEQYLTVWEEVCNIESPTDYKPCVDAVGRYFVKKAETHGWKTEILPQSVSGDVVIITMNPDAPGTPVALSGHIDTVHPVGSFGAPAVRRDETKIYGPGVEDCKGGAVAALYVMDALAQCGFADRPVMLLLQTDEEKGSAPSGYTTIRSICQRAQNAAAFLNCEGSTPGTAILTRKGILRYAFTVRGISTHSADCVNGASAIAEAAHKILALETMKDKDGLTCSCGVISGGTVANVVAEECRFTADIRFATAEQMRQAQETVQRVADETHISGCTCTVEQVSRRPAMEASEKNYDLLRRMNEIFAETGLPILQARHGGGGSDTAYTTEYGIPCVDSVGVAGGAIHSVHEYAILESLRDAAKRLAVTVWKI